MLHSGLLHPPARLVLPEGIRCLSAGYHVRLAEGPEDRLAAFRLRYEVFNRELNEGLAESHATGLDRDDFDFQMSHLLVFENATRQLIGTYRLQTGPMARAGLGFYSASEFDFAPFEPLEDRILELGRACIHREHRTATVILLLWQAIAGIARNSGSRYLMGCSSLTSQDPAVGHAAWRHFSAGGFLAPAELQTRPLPAFRLRADIPPAQKPHIPRLLRAYLGMGARICSPAAIDRKFGTLDFLTLLDLESANPTASARFLKTLEKPA